MRFVSAQALVNSIKNKVSASLEDAIEIGNFKFRDVDVVIIIGYSGVDDCWNVKSALWMAGKH